MPTRPTSSVDTLLVRPRPSAPVTPAAWAATLERARRLGVAEVRLAGREPLLAPGLLEVLAGAPRPAIALAVETCGLAWGVLPAEVVGALPVSRWELVVQTLDPSAAAALVGHTAPSALREAWEVGPPGHAPVDVTWEPAPGDLATPAALPAWAATRFGARRIGGGPRLTVRGPGGAVRPALLERQLAALAHANRVTRLGVTFDHALPACVHLHLPGVEAHVPGSPLAERAASAPPRPDPRLCRACPHADARRCAGLPSGWRAPGDDTARLRRLVRLPGFRVDTDAEVVALQLGLRRVIRLAVPAAAAPGARLALETRGFAVLASGPRELDGEGNLFAPGEHPSKGLFARPGQPRTHRVLYVAASDADARAARELEARITDAPRLDAAPEAHRALGALLGYPACCVDAFVAGLAARGGEVEGPEAQLADARAAAAGSARLDPLANPFLVARDQALISHAPCRYDCPATLALAGRVLAEMETLDAGAAAGRRAALSSLVALHADGSVLVAGVVAEPDGEHLGAIHRQDGSRFRALGPGSPLPVADVQSVVLRFDGSPSPSMERGPAGEATPS